MYIHTLVFKEQIWDYFCSDLDSALIVSKLKQSGAKTFKGGLNFTACLTIFAVVDFCSGFYKGRDADINTVTDFLKKYFSKYDPRFSSRDFAKYFYYVFRDGLSHQWAPRGSAIDMNFNNNYFLKKGLGAAGKEEILYLNIPTFYNFTKQALKDYENDLDQNDKLRDLFEKRYKRLVEIDYKKMRILREKF